MNGYYSLKPNGIYWVDPNKSLPSESRNVKIILTESYSEKDAYYDAKEHTFKKDNEDYTNIVKLWRKDF